MAERPRESELVYSTDPEWQRQRAAGKAPTSPAGGPPSASRQTARIWRDSKRRRGKTVTVVGGLQHDPATLEALLKRLKGLCGAGGTVKDGEIEVQGDHRQKVAKALTALGYQVKFAGG